MMRRFFPGSRLNSPVARYGFAGLVVSAALGGRFALSDVLPAVGFPFLTFFPAVMLATLLGGLGPGLIATTLSTLAAVYFFIPPIGSIIVQTASDAVAVAFFVSVLLIDVVIIHIMTGSLTTLRRERGRVAELSAARGVLADELAARVHELDLQQVKLRRREADLARVLETIGDGVLVIDQNWRITFMNARASRMLHVPRDLTGASANAVRDVLEPFWDAWRRTMDERTPVEASGFVAGLGRHLTCDCHPEDGRGIVVFLRDVTDQKEAERHLAENEARLRTIVETVPVGLVLAELPSGRIVGGNDYVERMLGHPVLHSQDIDSYDEWVSYHADGTRVSGHEYPLARMVLANEEHPSIEVLYERGDGSRAWTRIMGRPIRDEAGQLVGGVVALVDIDGERRTQAALAESEARLKLFIDRAPAAIAMFDAELRCLSLSRRFIKDNGLAGAADPADFIGRSYYDLFPDLPERWRDIHRRVLAGETVSATDDPFPRADGRVDWLRWEMTPWRRTDGMVGGAILFSEVVTDRVMAERALAESEERLRLTLTAGGMGTWTWDIDADVIEVDARESELLGLGGAPGQVPGTALREHIHPDDRPGLAVAIETALARAGGVFSNEFRVLLPHGETRWLGAHGRVVRPVRGGAARLVGLNFDITQRREAEAVLARSRSELEELVESRTSALRETEARLAQASKLEALGRLAGGVAHDFNNVLQAVQGGIVLALRQLQKNPDAARRYLVLAEDATHRGAGVTRRLLAFARRDELHATHVDAAEVLGSLSQILRHTLGPSVWLTVEADEGAVSLVADASQLETVLVNLAHNARDALPEGQGAITLGAEPFTIGEDATKAPTPLGPGDYVRVWVRDDGAGMEPDVAARATEPFFTTKPKGQGTGLGLAMARGFAEQSGGALTIETAVGEGTTVSLWLPRDPAGREPGQPEGDASGNPSPRLRPLAIVVVDDETAIRQLLAAGLAEAGHEILQAESGPDALALLDSGARLDAMITDLAMPGGMNGLHLLQEVRRRRPGLPAVLLTGHAGEAAFEAVREAASTGHFAVVHKPASPNAIEAQLAALIAA